MLRAPDELRLLLVDDEPAVRRAYRSLFERHGVTVESAANGREAAERVRQGTFDVIVSDISMPEMTGIQFLEAVRAHDLDVPVILMTVSPITPPRGGVTSRCDDVEARLPPPRGCDRIRA